MSLTYIIDGYNVINHPLFERAHKKTKNLPHSLLNFIKIKRLCGSEKNRITLVFDGYCPKEEEPLRYEARFCVIFSQGDSADERIKKITEKSENKKNIIIVSDDKEIRCFAKFSRIKSISVEDFIGKPKNISSKNARRDSNLSKDTLNYSQVGKINEELKKIWLK